MTQQECRQLRNELAQLRDDVERRLPTVAVAGKDTKSSARAGAWRQTVQGMRANGSAYQTQGGQADCRRHAPHLAVATFANGQLYPRGET